MAKAPHGKAVLYIAYHYPPVLGSSGVHRTLAFTRHLNDNGWRTTVLTASLKGYDNWSDEQFKFIPRGVKVIRAFCRNTSKHFSFKGKYLSWMALPDNWQSWILGGVISGLNEIRKNRPDVIVSTYPIASAHIIAYALHKLTGVPWVADLRDPMAQEGYPSDPSKRRLFEWIEGKIVKHCQLVLVTAPGAKALYLARFNNVPERFWQVLPNGFDEAIFAQIFAEQKTPIKGATTDPLVLLHSGVIYPSERDPSHLFAAVAELKQEGVIRADDIQIRLRATGHDALFTEQLLKHDIVDIIKLEPTIPYTDALNEMLAVDGLLLLQAANCNYQIPAKAYEYIRVQKPVLALTPLEGDTGQLLASAHVAEIAPLNDKNKIKLAIVEYISKIKCNGFEFPDQTKLQTYSRQHQAERLQLLLESIVAR